MHTIAHSRGKLLISLECLYRICILFTLLPPKCKHTYNTILQKLMVLDTNLSECMLNNLDIITTECPNFYITCFTCNNGCTECNKYFRESLSDTSFHDFIVQTFILDIVKTDKLENNWQTIYNCYLPTILKKIQDVKSIIGSDFTFFDGILVNPSHIV